MRLWHKDLVSRLPDKQLRGQWRECILIAKALKEGNLNHIIVNRVKEYPLAHYIRYCQIVAAEMHRRGYKADWALLWRTLDKNNYDVLHIKAEDIFPEWHCPRYLAQCYYNLEEKYDCGGITEDEFEEIKKVKFWKITLDNHENVW